MNVKFSIAPCYFPNTRKYDFSVSVNFNGRGEIIVFDIHAIQIFHVPKVRSTLQNFSNCGKNGCFVSVA
jgi:hypothetical protein